MSLRELVRLARHHLEGKSMGNYVWKYEMPDGFDNVILRSDGEVLTGLWFEGSRDDMRDARGCERREAPEFRDTCRWLDAYFAGHDPGFMPRYRIDGATPFRRAVIDEMLKIPYGATVSYGDIAKALERKRGGRVSAQAVGGAVGWNPICIVIPCHRVIGADGSLTGYGGGLENKVSLLAHEGRQRYVVTGTEGRPDAVLIRGVEGAEGPGRLTKLLKIDRSLNREDLVRSDCLCLETDGSRVKFTAAPRIGIAYASKRDQKRKWRFTLNRAST